jgi:hypothetical protein
MAAGAAALLCATPSFCGNVSVRCTLDTFNVSAAKPTVSANLVCPQFDPSLGTLTSYGLVAIPNDATIPFATFTLQNNTSSQPTSPFLFAFDIRGVGFLPGGYQITLAWLLGARGPVNLPPGATQLFPENPQFLGDLGGGTPQVTSLDSYVGTGQLVIPITIQVRDLAPANRDPQIVLQGYSATLTSPAIFLIFDPPAPVPEPASVALLASGLVALALHARKQRRNG